MNGVVMSSLFWQDRWEKVLLVVAHHVGGQIHEYAASGELRKWVGAASADVETTYLAGRR